MLNQDDGKKEDAVRREKERVEERSEERTKRVRVSWLLPCEQREIPEQSWSPDRLEMHHAD